MLAPISAAGLRRPVAPQRDAPRRADRPLAASASAAPSDTERWARQCIDTAWLSIITCSSTPPIASRASGPSQPRAIATRRRTPPSCFPSQVPFRPSRSGKGHGGSTECRICSATADRGAMYLSILIHSSRGRSSWPTMPLLDHRFRSRTALCTASCVAVNFGG